MTGRKRLVVRAEDMESKPSPCRSDQRSGCCTRGISHMRFGWCRGRTLPMPKTLTLVHTWLASAVTKRGSVALSPQQSSFHVTKWCWVLQGTFFWAAPSSAKVPRATNPTPPAFPSDFPRSFQTTMIETLKLPHRRTKPLQLIKIFLC